MGQSSRQKPARLAEKLLRIRTALKLSQNEMLAHMGFSEQTGKYEPTLAILLAYARAANVWARCFWLMTI